MSGWLAMKRDETETPRPAAVPAEASEASFLFEGRKCEFCDKTATQYLFAAFICGSDDCIGRAQELRGGPGGHRIKSISF